MATYISFLSLTEQGVKTIKDLPARIAAGRQAFEANGGKLIQYQWWQTDSILPDDGRTGCRNCF